MSNRNLVLGVDGGGTSTRALLADAATGTVVAEGLSGPSNIKSVGFEEAMRAIQMAVEFAFVSVRRPPEIVRAACFALAGAGRAEDHPPIKDWAKAVGIAEVTTIVPDALAVLAAGTPDIIGVSLISGTGSMALARNHEHLQARAGGWGYLFGDEGSSYWLVISALRCVAQAADGRGPSTALSQHILKALDLVTPRSLPTVLYSDSWTRPELARMARIVDHCAGFDPTAQRLIDESADELVRAVQAVIDKLEWKSKPTVFGTGGFILGSDHLQQALETKLESRGLSFQIVSKPVLGAMRIARRVFLGETW